MVKAVLWRPARVSPSDEDAVLEGASPTSTAAVDSVDAVAPFLAPFPFLDTLVATYSPILPNAYGLRRRGHPVTPLVPRCRGSQKV